MSKPACPIEMHGGRVCGREMYDANGLCLCHSDSSRHNAEAFQHEITGMLERGDCDFTNFVFPVAAIFEGHTFTRPAYFDGVRFWNRAEFGGAKFESHASFVGASFGSPATFDGAVFHSDLDCHDAVFRSDASFASATFQDETRFGATTFQAKVTFAEATFAGAIVFQSATFGGEALFEQAAFKGAEFGSAVFRGRAHFQHATFEGKAVFDQADFAQFATFQAARFEQLAGFTGATFQNEVILSAGFQGDAAFNNAAFCGDTSFDGATFQGSADFMSSVFGDPMSFSATTFMGTRFQRKAQFARARFRGEADFSGATFEASAGFIGAEFQREARFFHMSFRQEAHFVSATFGAAARFVGEKINIVKNGVRVEPMDNRVFSSEADADFRSAVFSQPTRVVFHHVSLRRTRFLDVDVREVILTDVEWAARSSGHFAVWDELGTSDDERNHELIAKLYRQLKHNYEERRDPIRAGDFHVGEMEMRRLARPPNTRIRRFLKRNVCSLALYKWISWYGEDYMRPFWRTVTVILGFAAAFALVPALALQTSTDPMQPQPVHGWWPHMLYSLMCFLLRGDKPFEPMTLAGYYASVIEGIMGPPLIAMFVLALNRRFKR